MNTFCFNEITQGGLLSGSWIRAGQQEKNSEESCRESFKSSKITFIIRGRVLVEIMQMLKMLLLTCHVGMRNMSLDIERKSFLLISSRKMAKLFASTWWKIELVSIGFGCLVEEIFQQSVKI